MVTSSRLDRHQSLLPQEHAVAIACQVVLWWLPSTSTSSSSSSSSSQSSPPSSSSSSSFVVVINNGATNFPLTFLGFRGSAVEINQACPHPRDRLQRQNTQVHPSYLQGGSHGEHPGGTLGPAVVSLRSSRLFRWNSEDVFTERKWQLLVPCWSTDWSYQGLRTTGQRDEGGINFRRSCHGSNWRSIIVVIFILRVVIVVIIIIIVVVVVINSEAFFNQPSDGHPSGRQRQRSNICLEFFRVQNRWGKQPGILGGSRGGPRCRSIPEQPVPVWTSFHYLSTATSTTACFLHENTSPSFSNRQVFRSHHNHSHAGQGGCGNLRTGSCR